MPVRFLTLFVAVVLVGLLRAPANAQAQLRFRTISTGQAKCLDVINDGQNDKLRMAECGNYSGQSWTIRPTSTAGVYRLTNEFTGTAKCLDVVNNHVNDRLQMATCGNFTGQSWVMESTKRIGFYHLKNQFTGSNKCLDVIDGTQVSLENCGDVAGQYWSTRLPFAS
jgi:hypothetical protein